MTAKSVYQFRADFARVASHLTAVELVAVFEELGQLLVERGWPGARAQFEGAKILTSWMEAERARDANLAARSTTGEEPTRRVRFPAPPPLPPSPRFLG